MDDLHLSVLQMSVVFSAFTLSYSLFEIPSGWLGDVKGPRRVLTRIVLWWSGFTMLTGGRARVLLAGRHPLPVRRRRGGRVSERGAQLLALVSRPRAGARQRRDVPRLARGRHALRARRAAASSRAGAGGRASCSSGCLGIAWAAAWFAWYRDRPDDHAAVSREELAWIQQDASPNDVRARGRRRRGRRGARCCAAATCTRSARCISRSATGCTSTSPGCPPS